MIGLTLDTPIDFAFSPPLSSILIQNSKKYYDSKFEAQIRPNG